MPTLAGGDHGRRHRREHIQQLPAAGSTTSTIEPGPAHWYFGGPSAARSALDVATGSRSPGPPLWEGGSVLFKLGSPVAHPRHQW
nr:hypothetical protein JVH1_8897 [Rhodococcus sp. JVH1]